MAPTAQRKTKADLLSEAIEDALARYGPTMTGPQFCAIAHISERTARYMREEGRGPKPWRINRRWFYATPEVVQYIHGAK